MRVRRLRKEPAHLEITAFINLIVVLVPFLLSTAVFTRLAVLDLTLPAKSSGVEQLKANNLQLEVVIRSDSLEVSDRIGGLGRHIRKAGAPHDMVALQASPKAVKLPVSTADKSPKETIVVVVSDSDILVDGRKVATVAEAMASKGDLVAPLKDELDLLAARQVIRAENQAQNKTVTIMGDKDIPYRLLRKVMYTSARANFADVAFAVRRKDGT